MSTASSLDNLWNSARSTPHAFDSTQTVGLHHGARRYLEHAIAVGTPLSSAVCLRKHGEIKLKGWYPFSAEEVICWERGMIWQAVVRMHGLPIRGRDCFIDGQGTMRWKLFRIVAFINACGPDISRSAPGRYNIEFIWLPSVLYGCLPCSVTTRCRGRHRTNPTLTPGSRPTARPPKSTTPSMKPAG
jgi:hypothetical protein